MRKRTHTLLTTPLALLLPLSLLPQAHAASVQYAFTGAITSGEDESTSDLTDLYSTFPPGTPFSGTITVDLSTPDSVPDPDQGWYEYAATAATFSFGATVMDTSWNNRSDSRTLSLYYHAVANQTFLNIDFHAVRLHLDLSGLGVPADSIPTNLNLDAPTLAGRYTGAMFQRDKYDYVEGPLTSFTSRLLPPAVPTPAAATAALPLLALTATRRRRNRLR